MKWPVDIIEKIAKRKVVLFLGAGVSANAISEKGDKRPPTWEQFLNKGISEVTLPAERGFRPRTAQAVHSVSVHAASDLLCSFDRLPAIRALQGRAGPAGRSGGCLPEGGKGVLRCRLPLFTAR